MEAAEAKIQKVLEGQKQFLVPHYQRPYSWQEPQWKVLWRDLVELTEDDDPKPHFLGSIVTSPARSIPEGVEKRLLIDGQQRLTTIVILLALIRDLARERGLSRLAERIQDLVTNRHEDGHEHYRLLPTQGEVPADSDRENLIRLVDSTTGATGGGIAAAATWFGSKLRRADAPDLESMLRIITQKLTLVSIVLDEKDNPHRIFESLNGKGRPLSQADLIRNFFFMRIHEREHERLYRDYWRPMQHRLGEEHLTDFVRHYLTRFGSVVRETDVYAGLKDRIDGDRDRKPEEHLKELASFAVHYEQLLRPEKAASKAVRDRLERLNRLEVTVAYPFLLALYADVAGGTLSVEDFCRALDRIENFLVRRFVCGIPTYGLNKVFAPLYNQTRGTTDLIAAIEKVLANPRSYPRDESFVERLADARLYATGERLRKAKLILERLAAYGEKEIVPGDALTIEHVMPQTLSAEWKEHLGPTWEDDHEQLLHTLGNLTLTAFNSELGNLPFNDKKVRLAESNVSLNHYFRELDRWTSTDIEKRAEVLAERALVIWPYFGPTQTAPDGGLRASDEVTGTVPRSVRVRDEAVAVQSWVDVAIATMEAIIRIGDEEFTAVMAELPKFVNTDATAFRRSSRLKKLSNGAYIETNQSALGIHRLCVQAVQLAGLQPDEWTVVRADDDDGEGGGGDDAPSHAKQTQLEFWTAARAALLQTGTWTSLRPGRAQYWYDIPLGRSGIHLSASANTQDKLVGMRVVLMPDQAERGLEALLPQREAIEAELGFSLAWNPHPEKRVKTLRITHECNVLDPKAWPEAIDWLCKTAVAMHRVFAPRVAQLELGIGK
jgi:uncharacterized protein with ParB-like and HNH nuclease domain